MRISNRLRKLFVKKRVYSFWFHDYSSEYYWNIHLNYSKDDCKISCNGAYENQKQVIKKLAGMPFVDAFLASHRLSVLSPDEWEMSYEKEIEVKL